MQIHDIFSTGFANYFSVYSHKFITTGILLLLLFLLSWKKNKSWASNTRVLSRSNSSLISQLPAKMWFISILKSKIQSLLAHWFKAQILLIITNNSSRLIKRFCCTSINFTRGKLQHNCQSFLLVFFIVIMFYLLLRKNINGDRKCRYSIFHGAKGLLRKTSAYFVLSHPFLVSGRWET